MRKIFSSQRVETAEGVAQLLRNAGIDVHLSNKRSYQGKRNGQFSYLDQDNTQHHPTVWIVHANDQPRARALLRGVRLLDTTHRDLTGVDYTFGGDWMRSNAPARSRAWWIRLALLLMIGAIAIFVVMRHRITSPIALHSHPASPSVSPTPADATEVVRVRIQPRH